MSLHTNKGQKGQTEFIRAREGALASSDGRTVADSKQSPAKQLDPDIATWARACRDVFGPGVKLYPDRYAHLWGGK